MSDTVAISTPSARHGTAHARLAAAWLLLIPVAAWWLSRKAPAWVMMWSISSAEFLALKILTLRGLPAGLPLGRVVSYVVLWPGMKPREFLGLTSAKVPVATAPQLAWALCKMAFGIVGVVWSVANAYSAPALLVGWVGMVGIIFTLHFGGFALLSWAWRRAGVAALPIMRAPISATSIGEFWGERWNLAFAELARRFILRPLARPVGATVAGGIVFLASGLIHETVLSLPARTGWGGPTLYFVLQPLGIVAEKSATGRRLGLGEGFRGWLWVLLFTVGPLPILFSPGFVERIIVPMLQQMKEFL